MRTGRARRGMSVRVLLAASLALCAACGVGCKNAGGAGGGDPNGPIPVGEYESMTGQTATFGQSTHNGVELATDEVNAAGGIHGRKIRLINLDDRGQADEANTAVTRLIDLEHVVAVLGEVASSRSKIGGRVCQRSGIPMITPSSTNPAVTQVGDFVFRVCFIDPFQGYVMARFAHENLHAQKVGIFRDVRNDYAVGLADAFRESFTRMGGTITDDLSYNEGDRDFSAQLTTFQSHAPEAIFVPGYYTEAASIAVQARRIGLNVPFLGGDGWDSPRLFEIGGPALDGCYFSNHYSPENATGVAARFIEAFRSRYHVVPDGLAALGYDAAKILYDAMGRAPAVTPRAIRDAIAQTRDFDAVTGRITLNAERNAVKPAVVLRIEHGTTHLAARVDAQ